MNNFAPWQLPCRDAFGFKKIGKLWCLLLLLLPPETLLMELAPHITFLESRAASWKEGTTPGLSGSNSRQKFEIFSPPSSNNQHLQSWLSHSSLIFWQ